MQGFALGTKRDHLGKRRGSTRLEWYHAAGDNEVLLTLGDRRAWVKVEDLERMMHELKADG